MTTSTDKTPSTAIEKATTEITKALESCAVDKIQALPEMQKAAVLAMGMEAMRAALTQQIIEKLFVPLRGTRLGFRTDRDQTDKPPYGIDVLRECLIDAMIRGFQPVGNEFNIIAGNAYFTKEGFERKLRELEGLTDLAFNPGVPQMKDGGALVPYRVTYNYKGARGEIVRDLVKNADGSVTDMRIPVRSNSGMGVDAILGKAKRKIMGQLWDRLTGSKISTPDGDVLDVQGEAVSDEATATTPPDQQKPATEQKADELADKHKKQQPPADAKKNGAKAAGQGSLPVDGKQGDPAADSSGFPAPGASDD